MLTLCKPPRARKPKVAPTTGREILRITEGNFVVGDVLLDDLEPRADVRRRRPA